MYVKHKQRAVIMRESVIKKKVKKAKSNKSGFNCCLTL